MNPPPTPAAPNDHPPQPPPSSSAPPPPHNPSQPPTSSSSSNSAPQYPPPPPPPPPPPSLAVPAVPGTAGAEPPPLGPSKNPLDAYPWTELEERFIVRMEAFGQEERDIQEEFAKWVAVFAAWASVTSVWEEERGYKRLRTRISWVQNAEKNLEEKRLHYVTAIKAFENVVALLNGF